MGVVHDHFSDPEDGGIAFVEHISKSDISLSCGVHEDWLNNSLSWLWCWCLLSLGLSEVEETNIEEGALAGVGGLAEGEVGLAAAVVHEHLTDVGAGLLALSQKILEEDISLSANIDEHWGWLLSGLLLLSEVQKTDVDLGTLSEIGSLAKGNVGLTAGVVHGHLANVSGRVVALGEELLKKDVSLAADVSEHWLAVIIVRVRSLFLLWLLLLLGLLLGLLFFLGLGGLLVIRVLGLLGLLGLLLFLGLWCLVIIGVLLLFGLLWLLLLLRLWLFLVVGVISLLSLLWLLCLLLWLLLRSIIIGLLWFLGSLLGWLGGLLWLLWLGWLIIRSRVRVVLLWNLVLLGLVLFVDLDSSLNLDLLLTIEVHESNLGEGGLTSSNSLGDVDVGDSVLVDHSHLTNSVDGLVALVVKNFDSNKSLAISVVEHWSLNLSKILETNSSVGILTGGLNGSKTNVGGTVSVVHSHLTDHEVRVSSSVYETLRVNVSDSVVVDEISWNLLGHLK